MKRENPPPCTRTDSLEDPVGEEVEEELVVVVVVVVVEFRRLSRMIN